jgi:hypothetical protein
MRLSSTSALCKLTAVSVAKMQFRCYSATGTPQILALLHEKSADKGKGKWFDVLAHFEFLSLITENASSSAVLRHKICSKKRPVIRTVRLYAQYVVHTTYLRLRYRMSTGLTE